MAIKGRFPTIRPSLDLNFAKTKRLDPRITFTRASSGTYVGRDGLIKTAGVNEARFDYSPTTGESLGLLVEEARTNLLVQSENFGTTWTANGLLAFGSGSTLNALAAPDGQTTADLITENTSSSQHNVNQTSTTTGAKRFSVFAKQGPGARLLRLVDFNATDGALAETYFNLSTGTVVSGPGAIQAFPNGWYRCSIQSTTTVTSTYFIAIATNALAFSYTGDGTSGIYLWGAQLEAGAFPTSYIPTTTAAATRSADVASIGGSAFTSFYNQSEGTMFVEYNRPVAVTGLRSMAATSNGGFDNRTTFRADSGTLLVIFAVDSAAGQATFPLAVTSGVNNRAALAYQVNNYNAAANGILGVNDTVATVHAANQLSIGSVLNAEPSCSYIRRLTYWPQRLSNATLQALTS